MVAAIWLFARAAHYDKWLLIGQTLRSSAAMLGGGDCLVEAICSLPDCLFDYGDCSVRDAFAAKIEALLTNYIDSKTIEEKVVPTVRYVASRLLIPTLLHRTSYNYCVLPVQGQSQHLYNADLVRTSPDTMLVVREGTITAIQSISPDIAGYFIGFDSPLIEPFLTSPQLQQWHSLPPLLPLTHSEQKWLRSLCELLITERDPTTYSLSESARPLLIGLISKLLPKAVNYTDGLSRDQLLTNQFKQLLGNHCGRHHRMHYYADALAVSQNYLFRCVKRVTGKAPKTLLLETIILHAMAQLQNTTLDINAIADGLGIEDPSYFGRLFKKQTAMTPSEYRRVVRHDLSGS